MLYCFAQLLCPIKPLPRLLCSILWLVITKRCSPPFILKVKERLALIDCVNRSCRRHSITLFCCTMHAITIFYLPSEHLSRLVVSQVKGPLCLNPVCRWPLLPHTLTTPTRVLITRYLCSFPAYLQLHQTRQSSSCKSRANCQARLHIQSLLQHSATNSIRSTYSTAAMHLPANLAITTRSRKFYDGTFTMVSDGFTDEAGGELQTAHTLVLRH